MIKPSTDTEARELLKIAYRVLVEHRNQHGYLDDCIKLNMLRVQALEKVIEELNQWRKRNRR